MDNNVGAMQEGVKLGKYEHFKGHICNVVGVARHSETMEKLVVYTHDSEKYGLNTMWVRPLSMFLSNKMVDGKSVPRFKYIGE